MATLLKEMFPNLDADILESVLQSCNYSTETAIEFLLGMDSTPATPNVSQSMNHNTPPPKTESMDHKIETIGVTTRQTKMEIDQINVQISTLTTNDISSISNSLQKKCRQHEEHLMQNLLQLDSMDTSDASLKTKRKAEVHMHATIIH